MEIYICIKCSRQISEDTYEVYFPMKKFDENATMQDVAKWVNNHYKVPGIEISFTGYIDQEKPNP